MTWRWRRWIEPLAREVWTGRLEAMGGVTWAAIEKPGRSRILLEAYAQERSTVSSLQQRHGGSVRAVQAREWMTAKMGKPIRIGTRLEIVEDRARRGATGLPRLVIPHGMAFGSGEHATTRMLLQALARQKDLDRMRVLDLGTGSGILALAARRFGGKKIVATDFDAEAIRTARQNEALNFLTPLIRWQCADVKKLRATARYDLIIANLFSGILIEAAPQISRALSQGGALWLSGILRSQQQEVAVAYRRCGLRLVKTTTRGKWVMQQWATSPG
ncbi:MAG: 50S ribosomal protein L11 methyltransferase [Methylacidiphilales bacterium]|nr:50S ribosomal protein L11 methyltransferase [Candidatus Methylacidiphilales bacterium]